jgi:long-chain acyl-CoA synthetase
MIIRGGENIYPREIDELLYTRIRQSNRRRSSAVPDDLYGEEVAAFVVFENGVAASEADLINFCRARLADFKCPKRVYFVADIPKGATGKLLKRELARIYSELK